MKTAEIKARVKPDFLNRVKYAADATGQSVADYTRSALQMTMQSIQKKKQECPLCGCDMLAENHSWHCLKCQEEFVFVKRILISDLVDIANRLFEYIDAIPDPLADQFPAMPGIDRDDAEETIAEAQCYLKKNA